MFKRIFKLTILFLIGIIVAFLLTFTIKETRNIYAKIKENNKKINFLKNIKNSKNSPILCFQSAYQISNTTGIKLPAILPLGSIPNSKRLISKDNLIIYDNFGFRNNNLVWKKNNHDYLFLGDSVVVDYSIVDNSLFSNNLENSLSAINVGCGGNGLLTSLYLLEQILDAKYTFEKILFFINLNNDFSKDTIREYNTHYFKKPYNRNTSQNLFLNSKKYTDEYLDFIQKAFSKSIMDFSLLKEIKNNINKDKLVSDTNKLIQHFIRNEEKITLADGNIIEKSQLPEGSFTPEMYMYFLKILERISKLKEKYNSKIVFLIVPTNTEVDLHYLNKTKEKEWKKYFYHRWLKNTIMAGIANYNFEIIDLMYFVKEKNYEEFIDGHFTEAAHKSLGSFIEKNLNNIAKNIQKLYYYNSYYPSKQYFNYTINFQKNLNKKELDDWIFILQNLIKENLLDNYLLTPSLSYFFINKDCSSILKLHDLTEGYLLKFSIGEFYYTVCNLDNSDNILKSINKVISLADSDIKYYIPNISREIKRSLVKINENN